MIGITSYGGYIPRLRLNRMSIVQNMGWLAPAVAMVAQGERAFCNWDEDSLTMSVAASRDCLVGMDKAKVDALYLASTTLPFADRLNAGVVATALNLRDDILTADFTSSQKAGTSALITALEAIKSGEKRTILVTAADRREAKAASFYEMWFGDGAASLLLGSEDVIAEFKGAHSTSYDFVSHYRGAQRRFDYTWEERWVRDQGYAKIIPEAINGLLDKLSITIDEVDRVIYPCFFKREHAKIAQTIGAAPDKVADNLHDVCGETGAAHPLVMLVHALEEAQPGDRILVAGFGQGCDALCFEVTESIRTLSPLTGSRQAPRSGVKGSLANQKTTDNYLKFLKFRDLIVTETGIRAEAPSQTAMTTLWRKRKMILGLVGGKCQECDTPQYPKMDMCVNPECGAVHSQEDYEFADVRATVKSFTGDMLAVSVDPPAIYGMVQFEGGGRLMADFTDCELSDLKVGLPVRMAFRRHITDQERGFTGYFWKAVPQVKEEVEEAADSFEELRTPIRFDGQVAIVTGGGGGLGRVYAIELARRGAQVVVNDLGGASDGSGASTRPADAVVQEIVEAGGEAVANYDSVATVEGGERIVQTALDHFGKVDILVNNAGILRDKSFAKMTPEMWDAVLAVHLQGAYNVTRPAFIAMRQGKYGRIVMTTSAAGLFGNFGQANYGAAKMGLVGLMNTLKLEGTKYGVKVNTVAPIAATRLTQGILPSDLFDKLKPEFVAPLVLYLCSEQCAESGLILNAGSGFFSRSAVVSGPGTLLGDGQRVPTVEQIHRNWAQIDTLEGSQEYGDANAALMAMLAPPVQETPKEADKQGEGGLTVQTVFERMPEFFQPEAAAGVDVVFQFRISGPGGGDWHVSVKEGACTVESGAHSKPTTTLKMADDDFLALIGGQLPAMQAFTSGKLKIEGDLMKSQLIEKLFKF
jgi:3-hydroxy-3-methylglutaryl CoA synthase/NAD(P)-dependent dehydrogenase (short-subunit alcohol dehydrogenase family)/putative sterol carrier protein